MYTSLPCRLTVLATLVVFVCGLTACGGGGVSWEDRTEAQMAENIDKRTVLFAPAATEPIAEVYPEASTTFASDLAVRVNILVPDVRAWASSSLPASNDQAWSMGPVGAASGAHVVVLTEVLEVSYPKSSALSSGKVTAKVRMRALNALGQEVWYKNLESSIPNESSPKFMHAGAHPASKAAWDACKKGLLSLRSWLDSLGGPRDPEVATTLPEATLDVSVTSIPTGADILIDGDFVGNTPMVVRFPYEEVEVRIQRAGFQPWVRRLTASPGMKIQPALLPEGVAPAAEPVPAPADEAPAPPAEAEADAAPAEAAAAPAESASAPAETGDTN